MITQSQYLVKFSAKKMFIFTFLNTAPINQASSNTVTAKKVASDFQTDVAQLVEPVANKNDSKKTSRFFGSWRDAK
jgi:hypothetical protein